MKIKIKTDWGKLFILLGITLLQALVIIRQGNILYKLDYIINNIGSKTTNQPTTIQSANYDSFAKCLTSKGFIMYGSQYCGFCNKQKESFGDSFRFINYVECSEEPGQTKCREMNITGVPTWIYPINRISGVQTLEKLSELSGCEL